MLASRSLLRPVTRSQTSRLFSVINLSDLEAVDKFKAVNSKSLLYFTATWCPPCKQIKPIYEQMAKDHPTVAFGKVDVDDNADAAVEYEISAVPTFVALHSEEAVARFSGADSNQLTAVVKALEDKD